jgi:predicted anti-sigma-YlaC factor YlaD
MASSPEHISCQEVVELVSDYLEQALPSEEAAVFEQHLNFCEGCVVYVDQVRTTVAGAGELRAEEVPPEVKDKLMSAFRDWRHP